MPDFDHVPFLVHFDGYDLSDKESEIPDTRKLALPKDGQKISRIDVRRSTCVTPAGMHPGMLLKHSAKQHGGLKQIVGSVRTRLLAGEGQHAGNERR